MRTGWGEDRSTAMNRLDATMHVDTHSDSLNERIANISVDFESIYYYSETLGLNHPDRDRDFDRIVDRFLELFDGLGVHATFFMVGDDVR